MPSNTRDLQPFVDRLCSRSVLSKQEQQVILDLPTRVQQVSANRDFIAVGDTVDHAAFVVAGIIGRFDQCADGKRQITAMHIPGDMADLHSIVQPEVTSPLQALSTATVLRIPHRALRAAVARFPAIGEAFWRDCAVDAAILAQWVVNLGRRNAAKRIIHLLCEMATRLGLAGGTREISFPFRVTQTQVADATGLTPIHVNRTYKTLRDNGLLDVHAHNVRIPSWSRLANAGDFDARYLQVDVKPKGRLVPATA